MKRPWFSCDISTTGSLAFLLDENRPNVLLTKLDVRSENDFSMTSSIKKIANRRERSFVLHFKKKPKGKFILTRSRRKDINETERGPEVLLINVVASGIKQCISLQLATQLQVPVPQPVQC